MDNIVERIRKLLARGNAGDGATTEGEALFAIQQAHKLLAEHGLTLQDIKEGNSLGDFISDGELHIRSEGRAWTRKIGANVARLYFCEYHYEHKYNPHPTRKTGYLRYDQNVFHGLPHNVAVAKHMFQYLVDTVTRLASDERKRRKQTTSFEADFRKGCAQRLCERLSNKWFEATRSPATALIEGNKLPALYQQNDEKLKAYMEAKHSDIQYIKKKEIVNDQSGLIAGFQAGNSIGLDDQIATTKPEGMITNGN